MLNLGFGGGGGEDHSHDVEDSNFNGVRAATSASDELRSSWLRRTELAPMGRSKVIVSDMIRGQLRLASLPSSRMIWLLVGKKAASTASGQSMYACVYAYTSLSIVQLQRLKAYMCQDLLRLLKKYATSPRVSIGCSAVF